MATTCLHCAALSKAFWAYVNPHLNVCFGAGLSRQVRLVAVSKTKPNEDVIAAYEQEQRHFGENYVCARCIEARFGARESCLLQYPAKSLRCANLCMCVTDRRADEESSRGMFRHE
jgi:hypothetical protein